MPMIRTAAALVAITALAACGDSNDTATRSAASSDRARVTVTVRNVTPNAGPVLAALQRQDQFAQAAASYTAQKSATTGTVTLIFEEVDPGTYAVAVFQDLNNDGGLELAAAGPTEPWALSGALQDGAPNFAPAALDIEGNVATTVTLTDR